MDRWAGKTAIVTGAASGIGEAIAAALIRHRVNVIAIDIDYERLKSIAIAWDRFTNRGVYHLKRCDVSKKEDIINVFAFAVSLGGVNIMVNNAGFVEYSRVIDSDWQTMEKMVKVFMLGTAEFMARASRSMREQNTEGHIINVNSVLGLVLPTSPLLPNDPTKSFNVYPACKHGTVTLTETVRRELAKIDAKIRVTSVCPGKVDTNISINDKQVRDNLQTVPTIKPEDVANAVISVLSTRPEVEISEIIIRHRGEID